MSKRVISVPVTWKPARRKPDDTVDLHFNTNLEVPVDEMTVYDMLRKSSGWLIYSEDHLTQADIPKEPAPEREGKSQSKRLYNSLFLLWRQKFPDANNTEFDAWYKARMENIINQVQEQLED